MLRDVDKYHRLRPMSDRITKRNRSRKSPLRIELRRENRPGEASQTAMAFDMQSLGMDLSSRFLS